MLISKITHIVKIGGGIVINKYLIFCALDHFASLPTPKILIHGGGQHATYICHQMGIKQKIVKGKRITDKYTLNVVLMTYAGLINKQIVSILIQLGCKVLGMSGADVDIIKSVKKKIIHYIDYGYVGYIQDTCIYTLRCFLKTFIPIFCSISHTGEGVLMNTNADNVSSGISISLATNKKTVFLKSVFDKQGVLNFNDNYYFSFVITNSTLKSFYLTKGMIPKVDNAFNALKKKVKKVNIGPYNTLLYINNKTNICVF